MTSISIRVGGDDGPYALLLAFGPPETPHVDTRAVPTDMALPYRLRATHRGRPIAVDGEPTVSFGDDTLFRWEPKPDDPMAGRFVPLGPLGASEVTVSVDARVGPETRFLQRVFELEAIPPEADAIEDEFGEPEPGPETGTAG